MSRSATPLANVLGKNRSDLQAQAFVSTTAEEDQSHTLLVDLLHDQTIVSDETALSRVVKLHRSIHEHWSNATASAIETGRALNRLANILSRDAFQRVIDKALPFKDKMAIKLMRVAHDIDSQRFSRIVGESFTPAQLPPITTAYELHTLDDECLAEAAKRGLVAPDVPRTTIVAFKKEWRERLVQPDNHLAMVRERAKLDEERTILTGRLTRINQRIQELDHHLSRANQVVEDVAV